MEFAASSCNNTADALPLTTVRPNTVHHFSAVNYDDGCLNNKATDDSSRFLPSIGDFFSASTMAMTPPVAHQQQSTLPAHIADVLRAPVNYYNQARANYYAETNPSELTNPRPAHQMPSNLSLISSTSSTFFNNPATQFLSACGQQATFCSNSETCENYYPDEVAYFQPDYSTTEKDGPLASRSELLAENLLSESTIALAAICDNYCSQNHRLAENENSKPKRKYTRRKGVENSQEPASSDAGAILLARFLTTSRDLPLVEVLREYGEHISIKWRLLSSVGSNGETMTHEPVFFMCHVAECRFSTAQSGELVRHMRTSNDCDQCPRRFHTRQQLDTHTESNHRVKINAGGSLCDDCGLSFRNDTTFAYHKLNTHNICPVCFLKASDVDELTDHLASQHEGFGLNSQCDECGARFLTINHLSRHRAQQHNNRAAASNTAAKSEPSVPGDASSSDDNNDPGTTQQATIWIPQRTKCQICGKMLAASSMRIHLRRKHNKEKRYKCSFCNYEAFDTFMLKEHMSRHLGEYKFHCQICDFVAVKKYQLDSHMRRHTGVRPFHCDKCNFSAAWNVQLKAHAEAHKSPHAVVCQQCNICFRNQSRLMKHIAGGHDSLPRTASGEKIVKTLKRALKVKVVKTAVATTVENFTISSNSMSTRLRSWKQVEERKSVNSSDLPEQPPCQNYLIVNRPSGSQGAASITCRRDDLMAIVCQQPGPEQQQSSYYQVLPQEML